MQVTIGQRIVAAVIAHQLGISADHAMKHYVRGLELHPSWEQVGETLLKSPLAKAGVPASLRRALGPQLVRSKRRRACSMTPSSPQAAVEKMNPRIEREGDVS
jgi:hypothetical protein